MLEEVLDIFPKGEFVFSSIREKGRRGINSKNIGHRLLYDASNNTGDDTWVPHDFRRNFRSQLPQLGVSHSTAERCLLHKVGSELTRTYDRYDYVDEKRDAMQKWADWLDAHVGQDADNVISLEKANG